MLPKSRIFSLFESDYTIAKSTPCFRYNGNCKIAILPFCFRYNGKFFKNVNFRPFPISNGNKTHFLKKSQFHFKRKQAFSGFLAFSIKKEISDRLKILFPFFVPAAAQYIFSVKKKKATASQGLPTVRGLFRFVMTCVFSLFVSD